MSLSGFSYQRYRERGGTVIERYVPLSGATDYRPHLSFAFSSNYRKAYGSWHPYAGNETAPHHGRPAKRGNRCRYHSEPTYRILFAREIYYIMSNSSDTWLINESIFKRIWSVPPISTTSGCGCWTRDIASVTSWCVSPDGEGKGSPSLLTV